MRQRKEEAERTKTSVVSDLIKKRHSNSRDTSNDANITSRNSADKLQQPSYQRSGNNINRFSFDEYGLFGTMNSYNQSDLQPEDESSYETTIVPLDNTSRDANSTLMGLSPTAQSEDYSTSEESERSDENSEGIIVDGTNGDDGNSEGIIVDGTNDDDEDVASYSSSSEDND